MGRIKQIKTRVEERLMEIYSQLGIIGGKPVNHKEVLNFILKDVLTIQGGVLVQTDKAFDECMKTKELIGFQGNFHVIVKTKMSDWTPLKLTSDLETGGRLCSERLLIPLNMLNPASHWSEIRNNFEDDGIVYIDAWEDDDDDSAGKVIATVNKTTRKVVYKDKRAKTDKYAQEVIADTLLNMLDEDETEKRLICPNCKSDNIQIMAWVDYKTHAYVDDAGEEEGYCADCEKHSPMALLEMKKSSKIIGFQVVGEDGTNHEGEMHPSMDASFCVYNLSQAREMVSSVDHEWRLLSIWEGDIEEPTMMFNGDPRK
ncbi:MAG: hypothetical protein WC341_17500 [Bacteroidales bacterium]|jgi:hypothetical protein